MSRLPDNSPYKSPGRSSTVASTAVGSNTKDAGFPDFFNNGLLPANNNSNSKSKGAPFRPLDTFDEVEDADADTTNNNNNTNGKESRSSSSNNNNSKAAMKTQSRTSEIKRTTASDTKPQSQLPTQQKPVNRKLSLDESFDSSSTSESDEDDDSDSDSGDRGRQIQAETFAQVKALDAKFAHTPNAAKVAASTTAKTTKSVQQTATSVDKPDIIITSPAQSPQSKKQPPSQPSPSKASSAIDASTNTTTNGGGGGGKRSRASVEEPSASNGASNADAETMKAYAGELEQLNEKKRKCEEQIRAYEEIQKTNYAALQEMAAREDELVKRQQELDDREKMVVERENGLTEIRAKFTSLFGLQQQQQKKQKS